ncbi:hypothetical protein Trydic_g12725 [Trypoxylus dichotomus]
MSKSPRPITMLTIRNPKILINAQFIPYERKEMFGLMDFVAYCGGLLGLFTGFSFLALLEVMYFICLRPLCNIFLFGRKYWAGRKEEAKEGGQELSN